MGVPGAWKARLVFIAALAVWAVAMFVQRLYQLQVVEGAVNQHRARENTVQIVPIPPPRGRIVDHNGRVLAATEPRYGVTVNPSEVRDLRGTVRQLAPAIHGNVLHILHVLTRRQKVAPGEPVVVGRALDPDEVAAVAALQQRLRGVQLQILPQRRYPNGDLASHLLGYVGQISAEEYERLKKAGYRPTEVVGKSGLEGQYDSTLRGRAGAQEAAVDALGHQVHAEEGRPPTPGSDVKLSLDLGLQIHAEQVLQQTLDRLSAQNGEKTAGAVVMLEARTGRVLALVSRPNFDPRLFARGISDKDYERLMKDPLHPLLSRAYQASYPPGSTFKVINASASLQSRLCTPQTVFYCSGNYKGFNCFVRSGHGNINFTESIAQSCDVTYYRLGDLLGIKRLARFAQAFGLGKRTGIDLTDEQDGLFATPGWKKRVYHEKWEDYDTINMAIGQGMLNASPLQMAVVVAAIANGGYIFHPHLVDQVISWNHQVEWTYKPRAVRRVPVEKRWLDAVRVGMCGVVDHGTATAAKSTLITIAGKTGTAEAVPTVDNPHGRNHTWFVSYAPTDHPQIVTVVLVVKAGGFGGGVAAPIAKDCIEYWVKNVRDKRS